LPLEQIGVRMKARHSRSGPAKCRKRPHHKVYRDWTERMETEQPVSYLESASWLPSGQTPFGQLSGDLGLEFAKPQACRFGPALEFVGLGDREPFEDVASQQLVRAWSLPIYREVLRLEAVQVDRRK